MRDGRRVVITGMGALTCLGNTTSEFWNNLKSGVSGVRTLTAADPDKLSCKVSGEVQNFNPSERMAAREAKRMARFSQLAVGACAEALEDAGLNMSKEKSERVGTLIGCGGGGMPESDVQAEVRVKRGPMRVSPLYVPKMLINMAAANVSRVVGAGGYTNTCPSACAAATQAIGEATEVIRRGEADVMITGGTEAGLCEVGIGGFACMGALTSWDGDPSQASRPFDSLRDGFVPSEGAGILILESLAHADRRGAEPLAEVMGWGVSADASNIVQPAPDGDGAIRCMQAAIEDADLSCEHIDYVNAHGTSTPLNDKVETLALKRVFGEHSYKIPISSTKSMVGHALGASGALEAIASVFTIREGTVHPTVNWENPDPECDLDYVPGEARRLKVSVVLSNSFGFGGQNACLVIGSIG